MGWGHNHLSIVAPFHGNVPTWGGDGEAEGGGGGTTIEYLCHGQPPSHLSLSFKKNDICLSSFIHKVHSYVFLCHLNSDLVAMLWAYLLLFLGQWVLKFASQPTASYHSCTGNLCYSKPNSRAAQRGIQKPSVTTHT